MLINILYIIGGLFGFVLVLALFTKKEYKIERRIVLKKTKKDVFDFLRSLQNHDRFTKWANIDPNMKKEYLGQDGTVGFKSSWVSDNKKVGQGEQEITSIIDGQELAYALRFIKPFKGLASAKFNIDRVNSNDTEVRWTFKSKMNYPMNIMLLFLNMEKMLGEDMEIGLSNLKRLLEK